MDAIIKITVLTRVNRIFKLDNFTAPLQVNRAHSITDKNKGHLCREKLKIPTLEEVATPVYIDTNQNICCQWYLSGDVLCLSTQKCVHVNKTSPDLFYWSNYTANATKYNHNREYILTVNQRQIYRSWFLIVTFIIVLYLKLCLWNLTKQPG